MWCAITMSISNGAIYNGAALVTIFFCFFSKLLMAHHTPGVAIPSTPIVSSPMPQFTAEEAGVEELDEQNSDVDIGSTTPLMNDDFWDSQHPNSPLFTPLQQIHSVPSTNCSNGL